MSHLSAREPQKEVSFPTIMAFRAFFATTPGVVEEKVMNVELASGKKHPWDVKESKPSIFTWRWDDHSP